MIELRLIKIAKLRQCQSVLNAGSSSATKSGFVIRADAERKDPEENHVLFEKLQCGLLRQVIFEFKFSRNVE
jgi:hypothetical protein